MIEISVRRTCSTLNVTRSERFGRGAQYDCPECGARSYRYDGEMEHKAVTEWISLEELAHLLSQLKEPRK